MADVLKRVRDSDIVTFWCPGCEEYHQISTTKWEFNGDFEKPTFSPSYLTWLDPNPEANVERKPEWEKFRLGFRCHSYIKDGVIQYLSDCTHKLAGKNVSMIERETDG
jgi:hypothetical protein